jgi:hypothetical protein
MLLQTSCYRRGGDATSVECKPSTPLGSCSHAEEEDDDEEESDEEEEE